MKLILLVALGGLAAGCAHQQQAESAHSKRQERLAACRAVLEAQQQDWNRGDLNAFAAGYRRSPDTVFATTSGTRLGFDAMLDGYRRGYPDAASMGTLEFKELEFAPLGEEAAMARGQWHLTRGSEHRFGWFVLVFVEDEGQWRITLDFTTEEEEGAP